MPKRTLCCSLVAASALFSIISPEILASARTLATPTADEQSPEKNSVADKRSLSFIREAEDFGYKATFDTSQQYLKLAAADVDHQLQGALLKSPVSNEQNHDGQKPFVSASMLAAKAKQFDDGLCAAVELAAASGCGRMIGKKWLLQQLVEHLQKVKPDTSESPNVENVILGAASLGKYGLKLSGNDASTRAFVDSFMHKEVSKPLGFWTWSEDLKTQFSQSRILQTELKASPSLDSLTQFMKSDSKIWQAYSDYLDLQSALVNPFTEHDFRYYAKAKTTRSIQPGSGIYFLPPCSSKEVVLMQKLFDGKPVPDNFSVIDTMIANVRKGTIDLKPTSNSGWYDYHVWALVALLTPEKNQESAHIDFSDENYRGQLTEMFKGFLALSREVFVHINAAGGGGGEGVGPPIIYVAPDLTVEPVATFYLRRANSYRFVRKLLESYFGADGLSSMHRVDSYGPYIRNLDEELDDMQALFCGAYLTVCQESAIQPIKTLGIDGTVIPATDAEIFKHWALTARQDKDVLADARMMVPIAEDPIRHRTKVWVFCGWCENVLDVWYRTKPKLISLTKVSPNTKYPTPEIEFIPESHNVTFPVCAEIYVDKVLDRKEFRRLCDKHKTVSGILEALKSEH